MKIYSASLILLLFSHQVVSDSKTPWTCQYARLPCPLPTPEVCPSSCPLSHWWHLIIWTSVAFFFLLQVFPAPGSFLMSWLFASGSQNIGASTSAPVLSIQGLFPLGLTGLISLQSKGLSRVFSNKNNNSSMFCLLYCPAVIPVHDYCKDPTLTIWTFVCQRDVFDF